MPRDLKSVLMQAHTSKAWRKKVLFSDLAHSMHSKHNSTYKRERECMQHYVLILPTDLALETSFHSLLIYYPCCSIYCLRGYALIHSISMCNGYIVKENQQGFNTQIIFVLRLCSFGKELHCRDSPSTFPGGTQNFQHT